MNDEVRKGVILAAGDGGRLIPLTTDCPKVLLPVDGGGPIISYPIKAFAAAGIKQIAVVVGYMADTIKNELGDGSDFGVELHYLSNPDYLGGNAVSVHKAGDWLRGEPAVLCMGDHLIDEQMINRLIGDRAVRDTLCVDFRPPQTMKIEEATKVALDADGCVKSIGKELARWDAIDTGVFLLTGKFFQVLDEFLALTGSSIEMNEAIRFFISRGYRFYTRDVSGCSWMDVDTREDLNMARR